MDPYVDLDNLYDYPAGLFDDHDAEFDDQDYLPYQADLPTLSHYGLLQKCALPTVREVWSAFLGPILLANLIPWAVCEFTLLVSFQRRLPAISVTLSGLGLLYFHFATESWPVQLFAFASFLSSTIIVLLASYSTRNTTLLVWIYSFGLILFNESNIWRNLGHGFIKLRPHLMLLAMKCISYHQDTRLDSKDKLDSWFGRILHLGSYLAHPCSLVLGVWHPLTPHSAHSRIRRLALAAVSLVLSVLFLLCSTCLVEHYLEGYIFEALLDWLESFVPLSVVHPVQMLLAAYSTAIQFHFSHYFISFAAQSMFHLWNIRLRVSKPLAIEFPRSLVEVVVAWNIPMHHWLKKHVFRPLQHRCGNIYLTILATYLVSSLLHGLDIQVWAVLLTLGFLTQAEFKLRTKLAYVFDACVESRSCPKGTTVECANRHTNTGQQVSVRLANLLFTCIAVCNLAFLGSTFDGKPQSSSLENVVSVWGELCYYSHILALIMFLLYRLI